jgi:hypothetical protein
MARLRIGGDGDPGLVPSHLLQEGVHEAGALSVVGQLPALSPTFVPREYRVPLAPASPHGVDHQQRLPSDVLRAMDVVHHAIVSPKRHPFDGKHGYHGSLPFGVSVQTPHPGLG